MTWQELIVMLLYLLRINGVQQLNVKLTLHLRRDSNSKTNNKVIWVKART